MQSWTSKVPKMAQPDLNFLAPEVQLGRNCCPLSDMFSLGMLVCAVYNGGHSLIAADHNPNLYVKQLDQVNLNSKTLFSKDCIFGSFRPD